MPPLNEGMHTGEFIGEYAMGIGYHVDTKTVLSGENLQAGEVVGTVTATGKFAAYDLTGTDGDENASGIAYKAANATSADLESEIVMRGPMIVNANDLIWPAGITDTQRDAGIADLLALGIKVV